MPSFSRKSILIWSLSLSALLLFIYGVRKGFYMHERLQAKGCIPLEENVIPLLPSFSKQSVRFIAMGDHGTGALDQKEVAQAIKQVCDAEGCDFMLFLGDNFYPSGVESVYDGLWWSHFESVYRSLSIPIFAVLGNHDVHGNSLAQVLYSMKKTTWHMPNFEYDFTAGPAHFFASNTTCHLFAWQSLSKRLEDNPPQQPWTFVFAHHPIYSTGTHGDAEWLLRQGWDHLFPQQVDFYLSGHDHYLGHLQHESDRTEYIVSGAGGKHYRSEKERVTTKSSEAKKLFQHQDTGFAWFEVETSQVQVRFFSGAAEELYSFTKQR